MKVKSLTVEWHARAYCPTHQEYLWTESAEQGVSTSCGCCYAKGASLTLGSDDNIDEEAFQDTVKNTYAGEEPGLLPENIAVVAAPE